jgi:hypothetical protein
MVDPGAAVATVAPMCLRADAGHALHMKAVRASCRALGSPLAARHPDCAYEGAGDEHGDCDGDVYEWKVTRPGVVPMPHNPGNAYLAGELAEICAIHGMTAALRKHVESIPGPPVDAEPAVPNTPNTPMPALTVRQASILRAAFSEWPDPDAYGITEAEYDDLARLLGFPTRSNA